MKEGRIVRSAGENRAAPSGRRRRGALWVLTACLLSLLSPQLPAAASDGGTPMRLYVRGYGGDFVLTDHQARTFSLADHRGKVVLIYFGYTSCADVCPTTLVDVSAAMRELGSSADLVQPVMVTVDPRRDTRQRLGDYLSYFHPSLLGLTGTPDEIAAVTKLFRAPAYQRKPGENGFYVVDHSSHIYVVDPQGRLGYLIPYGTPPADIAFVVGNLLESAAKTVAEAPSDSSRGSTQ